MQASPQFTPPQGSSSGQGSGVWLFVGCGTLLLLLLCVGTGGLVWFAVNRGAEVAVPGGPVGPAGPGAGAGPTDPGVPAGVQALPSRTVTATVTQVTGSSPAPVGSTCNFIVSVWSNTNSPTGVQCRTQVVCGGQLLYGGPTAGYFPCTVADAPPSVRGQDVETASQDGDAAMTLDTQSGVLSVRDDASRAGGAYSVTARVDSVQ